MAFIYFIFLSIFFLPVQLLLIHKAEKIRQLYILRLNYWQINEKQKCASQKAYNFRNNLYNTFRSVVGTHLRYILGGFLVA